MNYERRFAQNLRKLRHYHGLTQLQLARKMGFKSPKRISELERARAPIPCDEQLEQLASILKVDPEMFYEILHLAGA